jgi:hypothetical protein
MRPKTTSSQVPSGEEPVIVKQKKKRRAPSYVAAADHSIDIGPQPSKPQHPPKPDSDSEQVKLDSGDLQPWSRTTNASDHNTGPNYEIGEQDEFQNVWGPEDRV